MGEQPSIEQIKQAMRSTWMAGDFGVIARSNEQTAAVFARDLHLIAGTRVLDVATGSGNVAIPLARAGCIVAGVDIAPNLLQQARERAFREGLNVVFDEGDAEALPYADTSFDAVVTMFGAMFAPRPDLVAAEAARVLKPGGVLAMANWNPESFSGAMFRIGSKHVPPPAGVKPPVLWGQPSIAEERLSPHFADIRCELIPIDFDIPMDSKAVVQWFRTYFGPTHMAFERLDEAAKAGLQADLEDLWSSANVASDPSVHTLVRNEYLKVTARRK